MISNLIFNTERSADEDDRGTNISLHIKCLLGKLIELTEPDDHDNL